VGHEKFAHLIAVAKVGDTSGDGAGAHSYNLASAPDRASKLIKIFIVADPATDKKDVNLRHIFGRDDQRHKRQRKSIHPGISIEE
jgi:hypothetical protein